MSHSTRQIFVILSASSLGLFFISQSSLFAPIGSFTAWAVTPIRQMTWSLKNMVGNTFFPWPLRIGANKRIVQLEQQVAELQAALVETKGLADENKELKKQLEGTRDRKKTLIVAHPIGIERYMAIDRGKRDGVFEGQSVVSSNTLVGKVIEVTETAATVRLPTDPDSKIPSWTPRLSRGTISGSFGRSLSFEQVLQGDPIEVGDMVLTSGESGYVQNIAIGKITALSTEPRDVYKKGDVTPLVQYDKLRVVFILKE